MPSPITICFTVSNQSTKNKCLGYIDTTNNQWVCQDRSLVVLGDQLCGVTPHLTDFSIFLTGGTGNGNGRTYMLGSFTNGLALILPIVGVIVLGLLVAAILLSYTPQGRLLLYGKREEIRRLSRAQTTGRSRGESASASVNVSSSVA